MLGVTQDGRSAFATEEMLRRGLGRHRASVPAQYHDLPSRIEAVAGTRNLLAHARGFEDPNEPGELLIEVEHPRRGQRQKRPRQKLGPGLPLTPPGQSDWTKMLGTQGLDLRSWTIAQLDDVVAEARAVRDKLGQLYDELFRAV